MLRLIDVQLATTDGEQFNSIVFIAQQKHMESNIFFFRFVLRRRRRHLPMCCFFLLME